MIKIRLTVDSLVLLRPVHITVALPYTPLTSKGPFKTLWLLHPSMGSGDYFFDNFSLSSLVDKHHMAMVAPSLGNGYFCNSTYEQQGTFLDEELRPYLQNYFPLSDKKQENFLLGISMGGYGAMRWGLTTPNAFKAVAAISGVYDVRLPTDERAKHNRHLRPFVKMFGEKLMRKLLIDVNGTVHRDADLNIFASKVVSGECPLLGLFCGLEDYISINQTEAFATICTSKGFPIETFFSTGMHDMEYWNNAFKQAFHWMLTSEA